MKLWLLRWIMCFAWTVEEYARGFVAWAEQQYSDELHGIGRIK